MVYWFAYNIVLALLATLAVPWCFAWVKSRTFPIVRLTKNSMLPLFGLCLTLGTMYDCHNALRARTLNADEAVNGTIILVMSLITCMAGYSLNLQVVNSADEHARRPKRTDHQKRIAKMNQRDERMAIGAVAVLVSAVSLTLIVRWMLRLDAP